VGDSIAALVGRWHPLGVLFGVLMLGQLVEVHVHILALLVALSLALTSLFLRFFRFLATAIKEARQSNAPRLMQHFLFQTGSWWMRAAP